MQTDELKARLAASVQESLRLKEIVLSRHADTIIAMAEQVSNAFRAGRKLFLFGNGGSAADAQHIAAEFVNRFQRERRALPALALTVDTSILTCVANDACFEDIFLRQLQAFAATGDVAVGISTSGGSRNVVRALGWAKDNGVLTLGWAGMAPTAMDPRCDLILHVPSSCTARIQEVHIMVGHAVCEMVEEILFGEGGPAS